MSSKQNLQFFWDKKAKKYRSRFNLLLLEYGEYFMEDLSAYFFPIPNDMSRTFEVSDSLKVQGRLKLSSRSLIFEPTDVRFPMVKFPYKSMITALELFNLKKSELAQLSVEVSGFFTFMCLNYYEMKANDKIGPYKLIDYSSTPNSDIKGHRVLFALVHSDLQQFLVKVEQFRHIFSVAEKKGSGMGNQLLKPFIDTALITSFDTSHLVDFHEKLLLKAPMAIKKIKPLIVNPGSLMITEARVYFQPSNLNNIGDSIQHFELRKVLRVYKRRYLLRQVGIEYSLNDGTSYLFACETKELRDQLYDLTMNQKLLNKNYPTLETITKKWQKKEISNFDYLMYLNNEADRSGNDLTQYPVFPHIIADFVSKKLNLENPNTFRNLSKPIGALNEERLKYFKERFHSMAPGDSSSGIPPPFLYGTHYSTPGYVLFYLVRVAPEYMLCLQNGKFDAADRMFHSIADTWDSCLNNPADLKELIPEFFVGSGEFLVNFDDLDLGHRHTGERLYDVILPPWADNPRDFIRKNQKALECDYISEHIHEWIDLIFGYKQTGQHAIDADNLYYYLTYEGSVDLDRVTDPRERNALEMQIQEFGQTPKQLFHGPHPRRSDLSAPIYVKDSVNGSNNVGYHNSNNNNSNSIKSPSPSLLPSSFDEKSKLQQLDNHRNSSRVNNSNSSNINNDEDDISISSSIANLNFDDEFKKEVSRVLSDNNSGNSNVNNINNNNNTSARSSTSPSNNNMISGSGGANELPALVVVPPTTSSKNNNYNTGASNVATPNTGGSSSSSKTPSNNVFNSVFSSWGEKTASFIDKTFKLGGQQQQQRSTSPTPNYSASSNINNSNSSSSVNSQRPISSGNHSNNSNVSSSSNNNNNTVFTSISSQQQSQTNGDRNNNIDYNINRKITNNSNNSSNSNSNNNNNNNGSPKYTSGVNITLSGSSIAMSDPSRLSLLPSESFLWHSKSITGISACILQPEEPLSPPSPTLGVSSSSSNNNNRKFSVLISSTGKDAILKVTQMEVLQIESTSSTSSSISNNNNHKYELQCIANTKRSYSPSTAPLTSCCMTKDGSRILLGSLDNHIYGYSIIHANALGKKYGHDDGITSLSLDNSNKWLLSGSLDASVKLWGIKTIGGNTGAGVGIISAVPIAEFFDHENCIHCVSLDELGKYAAAGSEDGTLIVWDVNAQTLLFNYPASLQNKSVSCIKWLPYETSKIYYGQKNYTKEKLVCATIEGKVLCLDSTGKLFAATQANTIIHNIDTDGRYVYGGGADGSIRVWIMETGLDRKSVV